MDTITADQIKAATAEHVIRVWTLRTCSICYAPLNYQFPSDGTVYFNSNCDCGSRWEPVQERSYDDVARTFNMQTPEVRQRMWDEFIACGQSKAA